MFICLLRTMCYHKHVLENQSYKAIAASDRYKTELKEIVATVFMAESMSKVYP